MKKMNIIVSGRVQVEMYVEHFLKMGFDVRVYSSSPKSKFKNTIDHRYLVFTPRPLQAISKIFHVRIPRILKYLESVVVDFLISRFMRRCDILYGYAFHSLFSGRQTKKEGGIYILDRACPHCYFQDTILNNEAKKLGIEYSPNGKYHQRRQVAEYDEADFLVVPSTYTYNSFLQNGIDESKMHLVPLKAKTTIPEKREIVLNQGEFVVGIIGGNFLRKGFIYLLRAWDQLQLKNAKLLLKAERTIFTVSSEAEDILNRNKSIEVVGFVENINNFYKRCDVFCLPSIDEGFGMVVPEAMANSVPVIVSNHVGAADLIVDEEVGYIVDVFSSDQIAEKIKYFYENRDKVKEMGASAYEAYLNWLESEHSFSNEMTRLMERFQS